MLQCQCGLALLVEQMNPLQSLAEATRQNGQQRALFGVNALRSRSST